LFEPAVELRVSDLLHAIELYQVTLFFAGVREGCDLGRHLITGVRNGGISRLPGHIWSVHGIGRQGRDGISLSKVGPCDTQVGHGVKRQVLIDHPCGRFGALGVHDRSRQKQRQEEKPGGLRHG
jgi:hypothetical protein